MCGLCVWFLPFSIVFSSFMASLVAQMVKSLPAMQETWVRSLGQEDPLEKEMATHSGTFAWKIPWMEEPGRLQSMGLQRVGHDQRLHFCFSSFIFAVAWISTLFLCVDEHCSIVWT